MSDTSSIPARDASNLIRFVPNSDLFEVDRAPLQWNLDSIAFLAEAARLSGWCLPPGGRLDNTAVMVNGRPFIPARPAPNAVFSELYPWHPNATYAAFTLDIPYEVFDLRQEVELVIECAARDGADIGASYKLSVLVADLGFQIPPPDIGARIGLTGLMSYVMYGRSIYRGLAEALARNFGTGFADYPRVMDWGCGSARVARHSIKGIAPGAGFIGFDIDEYAIEWSKEQLGPYFEASSKNPPLNLPDASIDLGYAYSVFTRLADHDFRIWVNELARVVKPGGVMMFTVLSDRSMLLLQSTLPRPVLEGWAQAGIFDSVPNNQLDSIGVDGDYYRNVWIKQSYLRDVVGPHFDIVEYQGCFHFYQDLVVLRRK